MGSAQSQHSSEDFSEVPLIVVEDRQSSTSTAPMPESRFAALVEDWFVGGGSKAQKLESQVVVKLPWDGDTGGQAEGSLVGSSRAGPPFWPTQSSQ